MSTKDYLFGPFTAGRLRLPNRFAFMATINFLGGANNDVNDEKIAFYAERARGGVGAIVTEGLSVHPTSVPNPAVPLAYEESQIPAFSRLAAEVQAHGTRLFGQLWHVGRNALWNPALVPWSSSGERDPFSGSTPHAMSEEQIAEVIDGYLTSAKNLRRAGLDGVELHGAHGYLLTQFMSPWSNHRTDRWGGSLENRCRIVVEVIRGIREACGEDFVVGLKISAHEYVDGGLELADSQVIVQHLLDQAPPDYIGVSQSNFSPSLEYHTPDMRFGPAPFAELAAGIRKVADGVPVMAMAKVPDVDTAHRLIGDGAADLVGMSRALLADPHAIRKAREGRIPRPCIYCNVCWDNVVNHRPIGCVYGPETGQEADNAVGSPQPVSDDARRTVRVIGAGPAGLEVARVASGIGHRVYLYEQRSEVGGRMATDARVPGREPVATAVSWLADQVRAGDVQVHLDTTVDQGTIAGWDADDVVVQATGAEPVVEPVPGAELVVSLAAAMAEPSALVDPVVIVDEMEDEPVYAAAEALARVGHSVRIVTRREAIGRRVPYVNAIGMHRRLDEVGVVVHPLLVPTRIEDGQLLARHSFGGAERSVCPAATIVRAGPSRARSALDLGGRTGMVVGDASSPRAILAVVREANAAARHIPTSPSDVPAAE